MKIKFHYEGEPRLDFKTERGLDCCVYFDMDDQATVFCIDDLEFDLKADVAQKIYMVVKDEILTPLQIANYAQNMYAGIVAEYEREVHDNDMHERGLHDLKLMGRV